MCVCVCVRLPGVLASVGCSYPMDTVRRQLMVAGHVGSPGAGAVPKGMTECIRSIYSSQGVRGFYRCHNQAWRCGVAWALMFGCCRGAIINVLRAGPSQAIQFFAYGTIKKALALS